jgi:hypothetical protein
MSCPYPKDSPKFLASSCTLDTVISPRTGGRLIFEKHVGVVAFNTFRRLGWSECFFIQIFRSRLLRPHPLLLRWVAMAYLNCFKKNKKRGSTRLDQDICRIHFRLVFSLDSSSYSRIYTSGLDVHVGPVYNSAARGWLCQRYPIVVMVMWKECTSDQAMESSRNLLLRHAHDQT